MAESEEKTEVNNNEETQEVKEKDTEENKKD